MPVGRANCLARYSLSSLSDCSGTTAMRSVSPFLQLQYLDVTKRSPELSSAVVAYKLGDHSFIASQMHCITALPAVMYATACCPCVLRPAA